MASIPLYGQGFLKISQSYPRSGRIWLQMTLRLNFGVNTMWQLHIHFVWERL